MTSTEVTDAVDPFDEFNRVMGAGKIVDPYPEFAQIRGDSGVQAADIRKVMGLESTEAAPEGPPVYTVCSFDAVLEVLRDGVTYSSKVYEPIMGAVMGHTILEMDEPEHHRYRALIQQAFTKRALERWEHDLVAPVIDELIDRFIADGHAELVKQLTFPFPMYVIGRLLGLPWDELPRFQRLGVELISVGFNWDLAMRASATLKEYIGELLVDRRETPTDDLLSLLARAEIDGHTLTDDEILAFIRLLLPAGAETTYRSSSNLLYGLLTHVDQLEALRADRTLMPAAIEEGLRWEPPLLTIVRMTTRDVELSGVKIPKGGVVIINLGSANHDETKWERAEDFDIFRKAQQHMAFAFGPHMCLGMHLARMETRVVLTKILDRLPNVRLDPDAVSQPITGMTFRAPLALPVRFG